MDRKVLEIGLFAAIAIAVGGFGGTEPVSWGVSEVIVFTLGLLLIARLSSRSAREYAGLAWLPLLLGAWIAFQWLASRAGKIGLDSHSIETRALALATAVTAFFVALDLARLRESRRRLALFLIGLGLFEAFYGLAQYLAGWNYIWTVPRRYYLGSASGTYVNHNHFAGLLEMILPLSLGFALYRWQSARRHRGSARRALIEVFNDPAMIQSLLLLFAAAILFVAVVFSFSRMGMISVFVSLGVVGGVQWIESRRNLFPSGLIFLLLAAGLAAAAWMGVAPVIEHFEQLPQNEPLAAATVGRMAVWRDTLGLVRAHPLAGVGFGCFRYAFTAVQSTQLTYLVDHAHNDYLEFAAELGLPGAALFFTPLFWIAFRTLRASLRAPSRLARSLALGSLGASVALLVHSAADFNLCIPANALVFAVVLALGYAASFDEPAAPSVAAPSVAAPSVTAPLSG